MKRFTRVGGALSAGEPGIATTYVLTAEQFDFFKDAGFTDSELDAAPIGGGHHQRDLPDLRCTGRGGYVPLLREAVRRG